MSKFYTLKFGSGDPRTNTGLSPTLVLFYQTSNGQTLPAPGITETLVGSGLYVFTYGPTVSINFLADGGIGLSGNDRWSTGSLDPIQAVDQQLGYSTDSFGSTATDPGTVFGIVKRLQEDLEGDQFFTKATGIWQIFSRGSSTLLRQKTIANNNAQVTRS